MLMRFDPFQELTRQATTGTRRQPASMPMDAYRQGDQIHIYLDVPGVTNEDLDVTVEKNALTVTATRVWEPAEDVQILAGERTQGRYSRTIQLGDNVNTDELDADYEEGVLHLIVPVADKAKPRRIEVGRRSESSHSSAN